MQSRIKTKVQIQQSLEGNALGSRKISMRKAWKKHAKSLQRLIKM